MDLSSWFRRTLLRNTDKTQNPEPPKQNEPEGELLGVTDQLINLVKSFTLETFKTFPLPDDEGATCGDNSLTTSSNSQNDLSEWQQRHAILVLSKVKVEFIGFCKSCSSKNLECCLFQLVGSTDYVEVAKIKELSHLRYKLCPGHLKEHQFWRVYFMLVKKQVAEYELRAIQLARLKEVKMENERSTSADACEVEMAEAKHIGIASLAPTNP